MGPLHSGRFIGTTDISLSKEGRFCAGLLAETLCGQLTGTVLCLTSPLKRSQETAALALYGLGCGVRIDSDLREIDFGRWEGLSFDQINKQDPVAVKRWVNDFMGFEFPGGEAISRFAERVEAVGTRIIESHEEHIVIFSHGGVIRFLICILLGLSPENHLLFKVRTGSVTAIDIFEKKGVLVGINDLCHRKGRQG